VTGNEGGHRIRTALERGRLARMNGGGGKAEGFAGGTPALQGRPSQ